MEGGLYRISKPKEQLGRFFPPPPPIHHLNTVVFEGSSSCELHYFAWAPCDSQQKPAAWINEQSAPGRLPMCQFFIVIMVDWKSQPHHPLIILYCTAELIQKYYLKNILTSYFYLLLEINTTLLCISLFGDCVCSAMRVMLIYKYVNFANIYPRLHDPFIIERQSCGPKWPVLVFGRYSETTVRYRGRDHREEKGQGHERRGQERSVGERLGKVHVKVATV